MPLKYGYGQNQGMEYNRPGGDSFNGRQGSQTSGALMNQNTQPGKASTDPYSMFKESSASWYQPQRPRQMGQSLGAPSLAQKPAMSPQSLQGSLRPPQPAPMNQSLGGQRMDPANLAGILRGTANAGVQPMNQSLGNNTSQAFTPMNQSLGGNTVTPNFTPMVNSLGNRLQTHEGVNAKTLNNTENPDPSGNGDNTPNTGPVIPPPGTGGTDPNVTPLPGPRLPPPPPTENVPVTPGGSLGNGPKPYEPPPPPPPAPGSTIPPTPPSTANREIPAPPGLPPIPANPAAPNTPLPPDRQNGAQWNPAQMQGPDSTSEISAFLRKMLDPGFKQAQGDLTNVLRGQAALTGDLNAGSFGNIVGREVGSLINQQQAQIADKTFQFDQASRDRAQERYNTDSQSNTERYRVDTDQFIQQLNDDTARFNIQSNRDLEVYLGNQATALANRQIDADQLRAYYEAELQFRGTQYSADRAFDRDALNAATQRYLGDLNNNLGWGNLQLEQYGIDRDSQIRLIQILQQSGLSPAQIQQIIGANIPGYAYTPGG